MIYMDNAATTRMRPEVLEEMMPYLRDCYSNPSAIYGFAGEAKAAIDKARSRAAEILGVDSDTIYFTSGGTESDNWALESAAFSNSEKKHIIVSAIEHHAILNTALSLERRGIRFTYIYPGKDGIVDPEKIRDAIRPDTALVSVMTANNEIGTIEPVAEIGAIAHEKGVLFHTDAVQAFGQIPINPEKMNIDLLSASSHKIYGPKGSGLMYIRKGLKFHAFIHGGHQERDRRAGTENVAAIVGFGKAISMAESDMDERIKKETAIRDHMIERLLGEIPDSRLNGSRIKRLPNNINVSFNGVEGESLIILLDMKGVMASSGSACTAGSIDPSHVLIACGNSYEEAREGLRLTISKDTTLEEADRTVDMVADAVRQLREMSPMYS